MALPIVHATAGYLIHRLDPRSTAFGGWRRALLFMAIAILPDMDFMVGFAIGRPGLFHRGVSHTLVGAVAFGAACGALVRWRLREPWLPAAAVFTAVYASHLVIDAFTIDARGPAGAQFFWPFSDAYYVAPVTLFTEILVDGSSRLGFVRSVFAWQTVGVLARETACAVVALALYGALAVLGQALAERSRSGAVVSTGEGEEDLA